MDVNLKAKSVIVTGGASNIGRAVSLAFAREGAKVIIADIDEQQAKSVVVEAQRLGAAVATAVRADVTQWDEVKRMVQAVEAECGAVDVLVNNVGWTRDALFVEKTREEWEREIQVNLWGMINCTRAVLDGMIARRAGAIVSMASDAGRMGEFREGVYAACKGGIIALTKTLAREYGKHGVRFNVVGPGTTMPTSEAEIGVQSMWATAEHRAVMTAEVRARIAKLYPLRRVGRPEDIAPAVVFLASDAAAFVTGQTLSVSGGYTMK